MISVVKDKNRLSNINLLGVAEYNDKGELLEWRVLAAYEPVQVDLYYEFHIFRKNVLEIR